MSDGPCSRRNIYAQLACSLAPAGSDKEMALVQRCHAEFYGEGGISASDNGALRAARQRLSKASKATAAAL